MPDFAHIANAFATDPLAGLLLAIALPFVLLILSERLRWIHGALLLLIVSIIFHDHRHLSFGSFLVALVAFASLCRDIPNQPLLFRIGISWFAAFALIARRHFRRGRPSAACHADRRVVRRSGVFSRNPS